MLTCLSSRRLGIEQHLLTRSERLQHSTRVQMHAGGRELHKECGSLYGFVLCAHYCLKHNIIIHDHGHAIHPTTSDLSWSSICALIYYTCCQAHTCTRMCVKAKDKVRSFPQPILFLSAM